MPEPEPDTTAFSGQVGNCLSFSVDIQEVDQVGGWKE